VALDPYRTLGLPTDASLDEVKRAYRALAKRYHPDTAGEAATVRFLAVRAAYETIVGGSAGHRTRRAPAAPWAADPDRARATRDAYQARGARRATDPSRPSAGPGGAAGRPSGTADAGSTKTRTGQAPGASGSAGRPDPAGGRPGTSAGRTGASAGRSRRPSARRKATLTSTSYDEAVHGAFEPGWDGGSWYGPSSGTYWTLNPREYADPRKHGPEYQERARRAAHAGATAPKPATPGTAGLEDAAPPADIDRGSRSAEQRAAASTAAGRAEEIETPSTSDMASTPRSGSSMAAGSGRSTAAGGVLTAGLAVGGLVAIPSFAVLLSSEMAGDATLATTALALPILAGIGAAAALTVVRRVRSGRARRP
jgi:hypothetical protein